MQEFFASILRRLIIVSARLVFRVSMRISISGLEHIPSQPHAPTILVANHFSWFDAPLLVALLPYPPTFLTAEENLRNPLMGGIIRLFGGIPVRRGHVDRRALHRVLDIIGKGKLVAIFPEGGVQPELIQLARKENANDYLGFLNRRPIRLMRPRAGTAYVAVQSHARILPVAMTGTNTIVHRWRTLRRPRISIIVGPVAGPFAFDRSLRGRAKRQRLDQITDEMMRLLASLLPPDLRGPYR